MKAAICSWKNIYGGLTPPLRHCITNAYYTCYLFIRHFALLISAPVIHLKTLEKTNSYSPTLLFFIPGIVRLWDMSTESV